MTGKPLKAKSRGSGPANGPLLVVLVFTLVLAGTAFSASSARLTQPSGLDEFLVDLCVNHRILYALLVTGTTAVLGFLLSLAGGWLLKLLRIDRLR